MTATATASPPPTRYSSTAPTRACPTRTATACPTVWKRPQAPIRSRATSRTRTSSRASARPPRTRRSSPRTSSPPTRSPRGRSSTASPPAGRLGRRTSSGSARSRSRARARGSSISYRRLRPTPRRGGWRGCGSNGKLTAVAGRPPCRAAARLPPRRSATAGGCLFPRTTFRRPSRCASARPARLPCAARRRFISPPTRRSSA